MHEKGNKHVSSLLIRHNFRNVTVTFLDDTPSRETLGNCYAQLYQRYINLPASPSQNSDLSSLGTNEAGRQRKENHEGCLLTFNYII